MAPNKTLLDAASPPIFSCFDEVSIDERQFPPFPPTSKFQGPWVFVGLTSTKFSKRQKNLPPGE